MMIAETDTELDALNTGIMRAVQRGGALICPNAHTARGFALRASITNFRTTRSDRCDARRRFGRDAARILV